MTFIERKAVRFETRNSPDEKHVIGEYYYEIAGRSDEIKPVSDISSDASIATGSIFTEVDTGHVYIFDGNTNEWIYQFSLQDSSSEFSSSDPIVTPIGEADNPTNLAK